MITIAITLPVKLIVTLLPDGSVYSVRTPPTPDLVKAIEAARNEAARQQLYEQHTRCRLDEGLVRVVSRDGLTYCKLLRTTKLHFVLNIGGFAEATCGEKKYLRRTGRRAGDDTWSHVHIDLDDLAALNLRTPEPA